MTEETEVVLFFEDGLVRQESADYAIELANRLHASVSAFMLLDIDANIDEAKTESYWTLISRIRDSGIGVVADVTIGDKVSGALKAMAQARSVAAIIWGGDDRVFSDSCIRKQGHWLARVAKLGVCPIVAPVSRRLPKQIDLPATGGKSKGGGVMKRDSGRKRARES